VQWQRARNEALVDQLFGDLKKKQEERKAKEEAAGKAP
jgi:hypothetical protein